MAKVLFLTNPYNILSPFASPRRRVSFKLKTRTRSFNNNKGVEIVAINRILFKISG
jgi:hypothetical protein